MPKKGGKKSGKLSRMTEEERLLYMQQKMMAEEEQNKKKQDMLMQFLKDKLAKEEQNSNINLHKLNVQWRAVLREVKVKELRKDIEILSQTFERVVDCKNNVTKSLIKDVEEADEQYTHALRGHLQNIDQLLELQRERLDLLQEEYQQELDTVLQEFDTERKMIMEQENKEMLCIQNVILAMEQNTLENESEAKHEFQSMRDEIKNKSLEEKHTLRMVLENTIEDLWKQVQQAQKNYQSATEDHKIAFAVLKAKDEKSAEEISYQMKKLQKIQESINILRNKISAHTRDNEEQNRQMREDKEVVHKQFLKLKQQMNQARAAEYSRLTTLTVQSNAALKELQRVIDKGEQILRLAEMCRKLETEEEKVLPFYPSSLSDAEKEEVEKAIMEKPSEQLALLMQDYTALDQFWKRYNKVLLEHWALEREKTVLSQDNQKLRILLKQYLDGISVSDEVLSQQNPLLILNNRSSLQQKVVPQVPVTDRRVQRPVYNVIEAAHVVNRTL
ncbi:dynein regulatory complex subunit 2 [Rana temporaria]|uniref:dynein regulatory complex subunit 2 n=1 Tax=Rana temporaria TaxID=8407 RepID=UPI001AADD96A|nr:dynein regulatory complex subunit 2 [Rana temporaria]XP_040197116.1 dynein regulatory complex subunit 2 [Rana temporaria]XP_040197117.1 dynein regulatory complex subunit 2 [Rana temporaria]XP_040197118.1 dynein regulatory complex subunit 2 [Rana temporaria]XP_040197119.1 dynein regulatory complex subunit 2 [Rana temporaria]XP_040197120.1 dynein regulatory complex subunit 2 [Rana temporaria]XP_040197121.1 dynein regulatory complex subunit 2 [Rana temporaria]